MEKLKGLRLISNKELRPGDLVLCWVEKGSKSYFEFFFILSTCIDTKTATYLISSQTRGVKVTTERSHSTFTSKGILFRDWSQFHENVYDSGSEK